MAMEFIHGHDLMHLIKMGRKTSNYLSIPTGVHIITEVARGLDYAHQLSGLTGGLHAIVDTSRNGAGSNGEWCNPPGRLIGAPGGTYGDDVVDTNLWIKPPGESDGTCNGGPVAGAWWPQSAVELTRNVTLP